MTHTRPYLAALLAGALVVTGCSSVAGAASVDTTAASVNSITDTTGATGSTSETTTGASAGSQAGTSTDGTMFDPSSVHTISLDIPADSLTELLQTYVDSGDKAWGKATVTIDGVTYQNVGIKLKGNSSLKGVSTSSKAETLPWRIRLDKYVDGQNADGYTDFTIRASSTKTSMNEAVALDLLGDAGLATEHAVETRFSVNGSDATLRLAVQNLDQTWVTQNFPDAGADSVLYKSDADGDWSWRGDDGDYTSSFDIEAGPDDYTPLIELLNLLNNGTDAEKKEKLPELVDLDSFATYLAFEDLVGNFDDIDGPGNNSYLFWDSSTEKFTVVAWDHNLAFGSTPGAGGMGPGGMGGRPGARGNAGDAQIPGSAPSTGPGATTPSTGTAADDNAQTGAAAAPTAGALPNGGTFPTDFPEGFTPPTDGALPTDFPAPNGGGPQGGAGGLPGGQGGRGGMPGGKDNPLVAAFDAVTEWTDMKAAAAKELSASLVDSGALGDSVTRWQDLLATSVSDLVDADTIATEADAIRDYKSS